VPASLFGDIDLHLIGEGNHRRLWEVLGAHPSPEGTRFAVWAPSARSVSVVGDFNEWNPQADPLHPQGSSGVWAAKLGFVSVGQRYKYVVEGADGVSRVKADPCARQTECPPSNASVVPTADVYTWGDQSWIATRDAMAPADRPLRIYEVHIGSWRAGLTYREAADQLAGYVSGLGFTHIELLPVAEHPYAPSGRSSH
jgi:1,4-alpha-glucan branching enzyme